MPVPWLVSSVPQCSDLSVPPQGREGDHVEQSDGTDRQESSPEINKQRKIVTKILDRLRGPHGELFTPQGHVHVHVKQRFSPLA